ncbi:hypothetical protein P1J78_10175 [Psychromarinibacter sp. C21-152]|uniref:ABC-type transport auxiliary lipoprotein component domain-containing protein n=1 Tax=Psychromarinibacter sediminicola TaxID=3033385 RepID=A0AAE3NUZ1_9RHOB|nr:hypothetical protein [Psychromarinibacter sediminicola]MDF0601097.1 hypothetical protein [Psychromarinibacter sediminicola]
MLPFLRAAALSLGLAGCAALDPAGVARLSALDPLTTDPARIVARIALPPGLVVPPGAAVLDIGATRADTGARLTGRYALTSRGDLWALSPDDAARLRALLARIRAWTAAAPEATRGRLALSVSACATGGGPDPDAPIAADLSTDGGARFVPVLRGLTAGDLLARANTAGADGACPPD